MGATLWGNPETETLQSLWARRWTSTQIAKELSRLHGGHFTRNAVLGRVHRLGLPGREQPDPAERTMRKAANDARRNERKRERKAQFQAKAPMVKAPQLAPEPFIRAAAADVPAPLNKSILDLARADCRWPVTDEPPHLFCGMPAVADCSYCAAHMWIAHDRRGDRIAGREQMR